MTAAIRDLVLFFWSSSLPHLVGPRTPVDVGPARQWEGFGVLA